MSGEMAVRLKIILFFALCAFCLAPFVSAAQALALGICFGLTVGAPFQTGKLNRQLLAACIVGLGAGMNVWAVLDAARYGIVYTVIGITGTLALGRFLARRHDRSFHGLSLLINFGTAICGGSAIAAVAPVIRAKNEDISVALATVFIFNAAALMIFPPVGQWFHLTEVQFGLWSALAIHDTSSVVGATAQYGHHALQVGTTMKLARSLWIVPATITLAALTRGANRNMEGLHPLEGLRPLWFIPAFVIVATVVTIFPDLRPAGHWLEQVSRKLLILTLFLIGSGLNLRTLKKAGFPALGHGFLLWSFVSVATLLGIYFKVIVLNER